MGTGIILVLIMRATGCRTFEVKGHWDDEVREVVAEVPSMAIGELVRKTVMMIMKASKLGQEQVKRVIELIRPADAGVNEWAPFVAIGSAAKKERGDYRVGTVKKMKSEKAKNKYESPVIPKRDDTPLGPEIHNMTHAVGRGAWDTGRPVCDGTAQDEGCGQGARGNNRKDRGNRVRSWRPTQAWVVGGGRCPAQEGASGGVQGEDVRYSR